MFRSVVNCCVFIGVSVIALYGHNMLLEISRTNHMLLGKSESLLGILVSLIKQFKKDGFRHKINDNYIRV